MLEAHIFGGTNEVGMNSTCLMDSSRLIFIDSGSKFPETDFFNCSTIVPDYQEHFSNLKKRQLKPCILITHGHEDHIGSLDQLLSSTGSCPIYGSDHTLRILLNRFPEISELISKNYVSLDSNQETLNWGDFSIVPYKVYHSIPGTFNFFLNHKITGQSFFYGTDFDDFDKDIIKVQFSKIKDLTKSLVGFVDSTNATNENESVTRQEIGKSFEKIFKKEKNILMTCFASNRERIATACIEASKQSKNIYLAGRSMLQNLDLSHELNIPVYPLDRVPNDPFLIIASGCQGHYRSSMSQFARNENRFVKNYQIDAFLYSARRIPGNELEVQFLYDAFSEANLKIYDSHTSKIHRGGHASLPMTLEFLDLFDGIDSIVPIHGNATLRKSLSDVLLRKGYKTTFGHSNLEFNLNHNFKVLFYESSDVRYLDSQKNEILKSTFKQRRKLASSGIFIVIYNSQNKSLDVRSIGVNENVADELKLRLSKLKNKRDFNKIIKNELKLMGLSSQFYEYIEA